MTLVYYVTLKTKPAVTCWIAVLKLSRSGLVVSKVRAKLNCQWIHNLVWLAQKWLNEQLLNYALPLTKYNFFLHQRAQKQTRFWRFLLRLKPSWQFNRNLSRKQNVQETSIYLGQLDVQKTTLYINYISKCKYLSDRASCVYLVILLCFFVFSFFAFVCLSVSRFMSVIKITH